MAEARGHSWNSVSFNEAAVLAPVRWSRRFLEREYPGLDGVDAVDLGWRPVAVVIRGKYKATSREAAVKWFQTLEGKMNALATLTLYNIITLDNSALVDLVLEGVRPAVGTGWYVHYLVAFRQLQPNS